MALDAAFMLVIHQGVCGAIPPDQDVIRGLNQLVQGSLDDPGMYSVHSVVTQWLCPLHRG
jgi:hypothetical protein